MKRLAILASGSGTNAEVIIKNFSHHPTIKVVIVLSNKPLSGVLEKAQKLNVPNAVFTNSELNNGGVEKTLKNHHIDFIILAGFLLKIPKSLILSFPNRIINIHPALLPKFGGKGMYGHFVHEAVIAAREKESGITIHLVDELYDHGRNLFQASLPVKSGESPDDLARRIHELEHRHFSREIEKYVLNFT